MQREGDGGGGVDESRCRREKSTFGRPAQTHAKAPEVITGHVRGSHWFVSQQGALLVSYRDASYLKRGAAAQALLALAVYAILLTDNLQSARAVRARCRDSRALPARPGPLSAQP